MSAPGEPPADDSTPVAGNTDGAPDSSGGAVGEAVGGATEPASRPWPLLPVAVFVLAAVAAGSHFAYTGFFNDDSLITIRYAENAVAGNGLVYNVGERHLGYSTPLWALLLTALGFVGLHLPTVATVIGIAAFSGSAAGAAVLSRDAGRPWLAQAFTALLVITSPLLLKWSGAGMEVALYGGLIVTFFIVYERERLGLLGVVGGVMLLVRPDAGLLLATAFIVEVVRKRSIRGAWRVLPGFAAVVIPWFVFGTLYYGSPLPNSGFAKRLQVEDWGSYFTVLWAQMMLVWPLVPFAVIGFMDRLQDARRSLPAWSLPVFVAGMHFGGLPGCPWYMVAPMTMLAILAGEGAWAAADAAKLANVTARRALFAVALLGCAVAHLGLYSQATGVRWEQQWVERHHGRIGDELARIAPRGASVGVDNIGYIGYRSGLRVVDIMGLVQPETQKHMADGQLDYALRHHRPEFLAIWWGRGNTHKYLPDGMWFMTEGYRIVFEAQVREGDPDSPAYTIFSRLKR